MKILQINTTVSTGSTGRIAEDLGDLLILNGHSSYIGYGRGAGSSKSKLIKIGNSLDQFGHVMASRLLDRHGFGSTAATKLLVRRAIDIKPDLIHLHNIHGYYLNSGILFAYLRLSKIPVVWTFHDCWPFTGHCSYFTRVNCSKWQTECMQCPNLLGYPASWLRDHSNLNYKEKKQIFTGIERMILIAPSKWMSNNLNLSFLNKYSIKIVNNGIDLKIFKPSETGILRSKHAGKYNKIILGVANLWDKRKGLGDFIMLRKLLAADILIILVGLKPHQIKNLPDGILGLARTENINDLALLYAAADVFVNPTYVDNFPTTNLEALACGTPVITYDTGGSPEAIDENTGIATKKGDINALKAAIDLILGKSKCNFIDPCRSRASRRFDKTQNYSEYLTLYKEIAGQTLLGGE